MLLITQKSKDYELLDSGEGEKLERYGAYILRRPDPQAIWSKKLSPEVWDKADASYIRSGAGGKWHRTKEIKEPWKIELEGSSFSLSLLPSKHLGVFPEQVSGWKRLREIIEEKIKHDTNTRMNANDTNKIRVLNLFAYTGGATMSALRAGAEVVHLDASKFAVDLAKKNIEDSGLVSKKVRFIVDDVRKFVEREIKRKSFYDIILLDPPVYGKGSKGESWKIESDLAPLLVRIKKILSKDPIAVVLNGYASVYTHSTYGNLLAGIKDDFGGEVVSGEMAIEEGDSKRLLTAGIFARWQK